MASREAVYWASQTMMQPRHEGVIRGERQRFCVSGGRIAPVISGALRPDAMLRTHGCYGVYQAYRTKIVLAKLSRAACIDKGLVGGPQAPDDAQRWATGRAADEEQWRVYERCRLAIDGVCLHDHPAAGGGRAATAGREQAARTDVPDVIGQDILKEAAEKLHDVELVVRRRALPGCR
jgi:hypothetical protein